MLSIVYIFHRFNRFLSTNPGALLRRGSELLLLTFACYMVTSEWLRTKRQDLWYLLIGFGSLAFQKLISTLFLAHVVFANIAIRSYKDYITLAENFIEISALIIISSAFLYPVHKKHGICLKKKTYIELALAAGVFLFSAAVALNYVPLFPMGTRRRAILSMMSLFKFGILWFPVYMFWKKKELTLYNKAVAQAFIVYSITPILNIVNWTLYAGNRADITVLAYPFPFIAVALFTRVLFLKLVDKATIKEELSTTKKKYVREKEIGMMKDEFVSTVSHELRTPLTSVRLYLSLLVQEKFGKLNKKQKEIVETVNKESLRLKNLIDDVLNLSRYEKKKEKIKKQKTNLYKIVDSCMYPHLIEEKNLHVKNSVEKEIDVHVDPDKFRQVIINLFSNAVKHTEDHGMIHFSSKTGDSSVLLSITDTGKGIHPDILPYVFDKFYQGENHMVRKTGGVGLGLAISNEIVKLHDGKIDVMSELNKGTTFTITLPLNNKDEERNPIAN